ncbi:hypothetical protein NKJ74_32075 [Mesorhizobium sp. M0046]|uniref:hypothetical protein n=1 Tax=Mesorhizobium sp. M0046 TaxID=2956858 RepID=UPI003337D9E1
MVAASKSLILWNSDNDSLVINDLIVVDIDDQNNRTDNYLASAGASDEDWLTTRLQSPMGLFLNLSAYYGFKDRKVLKNAISQFGKIEGEEDWSGELMKTIFDPSESD